MSKKSVEHGDYGLPLDDYFRNNPTHKPKLDPEESLKPAKAIQGPLPRQGFGLAGDYATEDDPARITEIRKLVRNY